MTVQKNRSDLSAVAFQVAAVLEAYQLQIERLAADWRNRPLYRAVSAQLDEVGGLLGAFPQLAVDMVEVVVCHAKLLHLLQSGDAAGDLSQLRSRQQDAVQTMRRKTLRLLTEPGLA
jgi:hypothetical protein